MASKERRGGAVRFDEGKPDISLIPPEYLEELARVFMYGTQKYAPENWRKGMKWSRVYSSAMRHLLAFWRGEEVDTESGLPHLMHASWNLLVLYCYTHQGHLRKLDDRWVWPEQVHKDV